jgi:Holliday junction resolvase-like predicted endonuclease
MQNDEAFDLLASVDVTDTITTYGSTADKAYDNLLRYHNVTSYSQRSILHRCPRKFQLAKYRAAEDNSRDFALPNLHFCFGHAVGAGAQNYLLTKDLNQAIFNGMMAWRADFTERWDKKKKSLWEAVIAIEKFAECTFLDDWELLILPNGKPAIELSFSLHADNGFKDYGHIDIVLKNKYTGKLAILELKTEGGTEPEEAKYANSNQALGYGVMLDAVFPGLTDYTVLYCVYSATSREWALLPFDKTTTHKAEWVKDLLLDHGLMQTYESIRFYPKRGESCYDFRTRCEFFGECDLVPHDKLPILADELEAESPDYVISLDSVISSQLAMGEN